MGTIGKLQYMLETKNQIRAAIQAKGVSVSEDLRFRDYVKKIIEINSSATYASTWFDQNSGSFTNGSPYGNVAEKLEYLIDTKLLLAKAIKAKGVTITDNKTFRDYADLISSIGSGSSSGGSSSGGSSSGGSSSGGSSGGSSSGGTTEIGRPSCEYDNYTVLKATGCFSSIRYFSQGGLVNTWSDMRKYDESSEPTQWIDIPSKTTTTSDTLLGSILLANGSLIKLLSYGDKCKFVLNTMYGDVGECTGFEYSGEKTNGLTINYKFYFGRSSSGTIQLYIKTISQINNFIEAYTVCTNISAATFYNSNYVDSDCVVVNATGFLANYPIFVQGGRIVDWELLSGYSDIQMLKAPSINTHQEYSQNQESTMTLYNGSKITIKTRYVSIGSNGWYRLDCTLRDMDGTNMLSDFTVPNGGCLYLGRDPQGYVVYLTGTIDTNGSFKRSNYGRILIRWDEAKDPPTAVYMSASKFFP